MQDSENQLKERFTGTYLRKEYVIGFDNYLNFPQKEIIWHK